MNKPPLGLIPKYIWFEQIQNEHAKERLQIVKEAMTRYMNAEILIPQDWVDEYNELVWRTDNKDNKPGKDNKEPQTFNDPCSSVQSTTADVKVEI